MGTHPIFESDFDCLTVSNDMILRRRGGSLRVVVGTSIFWLAVFYTTSEWWCRTHQLELSRSESNGVPEDLKPAKQNWNEVIQGGIKNGIDGNNIDYPNNDRPLDSKSDEKIAKGKFNPKVDLQKPKLDNPKKKPSKSKKHR